MKLNIMPFLLITGMHRSGTSFLARALNLHGVNLGELDSLLSHEWKAYQDNPRGHWENKKIYELSEKTLKHSKGSWHKVPKKIVVTKKISRELKKCVNEIQNGSILSSGFKDPRLLICFKQWKKYLPKNFVVIGIIRNPLKVAESLKKRDGFSYDKSLKLWKIYNQNLLEILCEYDGFLLDFDWPKKKLFKELEMISKKLGLAQNIDLSDWYSKDLLKSDKTYKSNYVIPPEINKLYSNLKTRTRTNKNVKLKLPKRTTHEVSRIVGNLLTEIHNQSNYFTNVFSEQGKELKQKTKSLAKIQKEFDERSKWALSLDKELKQKTKSLAKIQKEFDERSKWALSLEQELEQKSQDVTKLQNEHVKLQREYDEHSKHMLKLEEQIGEKTSSINKLQKEFEERSNWSLSLDKELKQKTQVVAKLQEEFDERSKWALSLEQELEQKSQDVTKLQNEHVNLQKEYDKISIQINDVEAEKQKILIEKEKLDKKLEELHKTLETKDAQIQNLQNELEMLRSEINDIKNSVIFGITSGIVRKLDKLAPESTRRKKLLRTTRSAYLVRRDKGTKALLLEAKRKISHQKLGDTKTYSNNNLESYLQTIKKKKTKLDSNVIQIDAKYDLDNTLREAIQFGSNQITNLSRFPKISIIIITYNQVGALKRTLSSIKSKSTYKNYDVIIVTNNHDENSEMRKFLKTVEFPVYIYEKEYSFGGMNNFGASKAMGEFLLFLNDDVEVQSPNWLEGFLVLALRESVGVVGGKLLLHNGKLQDCGGIVWKNGNAWNFGRNLDPNEPGFNYVRDVDYCSGSCLFVRKQIFVQADGFDRKFDPAYWEDTDLCFTIRKLGYQVLYQPLSCLTHYEGTTQGTSTDKGLKSYQVVNQKKFQEKWQTILETHLEDSIPNTFHERDRREGLNILYIDHYVPEPDKDSGSLRTFRILSILAHMKNKITIWPDNQQYTIPYVTEMQQKGIEIIYKNSDFDKFLEERKHLYDVAILARPYISSNYIDKIKEKMPTCKIIYDTIDLHFLRMNRQAAIESKPHDTQAEDMHKVELSLMKKSDITILTSPAEADLLHKEEPSLKLAILPNIHTEGQVVDGFDYRKNMIFLGGFQHTPNIDAVEYLVHSIWPKIKHEIPDLKLYIVGSSPTEDIKKLASDDIVVTGFVKDLGKFYKECKLMLAPIRYGAGVKGKITQSLAMGLPVITTTLGVEGIKLVDGKHCMIADSETDFAKKAIQVYSDKKLWKKLSHNGMDVAKEYSPEKARACLETIISSIF